jgi:hypothetical protein
MFDDVPCEETWLREESSRLTMWRPRTKVLDTSFSLVGTVDGIAKKRRFNGEREFITQKIAILLATAPSN